MLFDVEVGFVIQQPVEHMGRVPHCCAYQLDMEWGVLVRDVCIERRARVVSVAGVDSLQELTALDVGFVSLNEALDLTTPSGRALAGMLAVFAEFERDILRDRVKAGIAQARREGKPHGRPKTAANLAPEMKQLRKDGLSKRAIAKQLGVSRTSVIRLLRPQKRSPT
jgi:DNA invertase Pin-like site-specific DNA recombinase